MIISLFSLQVYINEYKLQKKFKIYGKLSKCLARNESKIKHRVVSALFVPIFIHEC